MVPLRLLHPVLKMIGLRNYLPVDLAQVRQIFF